MMSAGKLACLTNSLTLATSSLFELRPFFQLLVELAAQHLKHVELRFGRFRVAVSMR